MKSGHGSSVFNSRYRAITILARPLAILLALVFCLNAHINTSLAASGQSALDHCLFTVIGNNGGNGSNGSNGSNGGTPLSPSQSEHCSFCSLWADGKFCGLPSHNSFSYLPLSAALQLKSSNNTAKNHSHKPANIRAPPSPDSRLNIN